MSASMSGIHYLCGESFLPAVFINSSVQCIFVVFHVCICHQLLVQLVHQIPHQLPWYSLLSFPVKAGCLKACMPHQLAVRPGHQPPH